METITIGEFQLPLMLNTYTGAIADWPARILAALGTGYETTMVFHWALGGLFVFLIHRFLRIHGSGIAASAAALILCCDWVFVFFRRTLGGTEILLQAAALLCLWALWSRRWAGGRHGLAAFTLGVALGLSAKFTCTHSLYSALGQASFEATSTRSMGHHCFESTDTIDPTGGRLDPPCNGRHCRIAFS